MNIFSPLLLGWIFTLSVENTMTRYLLIDLAKDQRRGNMGAGNWTCVAGHMGKDGKTWFADHNTGSRPRAVIDVSIPERYSEEWDSAIKFITEY